MNIFLIIITIISIITALICACIKIKNVNEVKKEYDSLNNKVQELKKVQSKLTEERNILTSENNHLIENISRERNRLLEMQEDAKTSLQNQMAVSKQAYENYWKVLDDKYKLTEKEYDNLIETLENSYSDLQHKLIKETEKYRLDLDKMKSTRAAAIEAERREKEIEDNISFYCLEISDADKLDIAKLEALKPSLNKPRVLSMLIWQTWFQKPLKSLSANVIGADDKTGIYKITNIKTKECYIGQAVSIKDRWVDHCKCGLGIDTPANNKLYKAIQDYGLWNFSFEVLEECSRDLLNEKEKYYIDLYSSYEYGYNSNRGIGR